MKNFRDNIQYWINHTLRFLLGQYKQISILLTNKRFYCRALKGDSDHNISINSDLSVSCSCYDIDGYGKIGHIGNQSLQEIFSGEKADLFRRKLAKGKFPILDCARCNDLCKVEKSEAYKYVYIYKIPQGINIENTALCNLHCLSCNRSKIYKHREKYHMSLDDIRHVSKCLMENKIKIVSYFNWGEPFISKAIKEELEILRKDNPDCKIYVSTNGNLLNSPEKLEAALYFDHIYISLDGATTKSARRYQRGTDFDKAYSNMKELVKYKKLNNSTKPIIEWKYILFNWNDSKGLIDRAIKLAKEANIDKISFWTTLSPIYGISYKYLLKSIKNFPATGKIKEVIFNAQMDINSPAIFPDKELLRS